MARERSLAGEVALVTGASSGIGREAALALADRGADVVVAARRRGRLEALADEIESTADVAALAVPTDVTDVEQVEAMVTSAVDRFGGLDVVVSNAGTGTERGVDVADLDTEQYRTVMAVNTDGMFFTTRAVLPHLRDASGVLVFVGSVAGKYPRADTPVYAATKWWTRGFALSLAGHVGGDDVAVSVVAPTAVRTPFAKEYREEDELTQARYEPGEVTEPEEVAEAIAFAATQESPNAAVEVDLYRRDALSEM